MEIPRGILRTPASIASRRKVEHHALENSLFQPSAVPKVVVLGVSSIDLRDFIGGLHPDIGSSIALEDPAGIFSHTFVSRDEYSGNITFNIWAIPFTFVRTYLNTIQSIRLSLESMSKDLLSGKASKDSILQCQRLSNAILRYNETIISSVFSEVMSIAVVYDSHYSTGIGQSSLNHPVHSSITFVNTLLKHQAEAESILFFLQSLSLLRYSPNAIPLPCFVRLSLEYQTKIVAKTVCSSCQERLSCPLLAFVLPSLTTGRCKGCRKYLPAVGFDEQKFAPTVSPLLPVYLCLHNADIPALVFANMVFEKGKRINPAASGKTRGDYLTWNDRILPVLRPMNITYPSQVEAYTHIVLSAIETPIFGFGIPYCMPLTPNDYISLQNQCNFRAILWTSTCPAKSFVSNIDSLLLQYHAHKFPIIYRWKVFQTLSEVDDATGNDDIQDASELSGSMNQVESTNVSLWCKRFERENVFNALEHSLAASSKRLFGPDASLNAILLYLLRNDFNDAPSKSRWRYSTLNHCRSGIDSIPITISDHLYTPEAESSYPFV